MNVALLLFCSMAAGVLVGVIYHVMAKHHVLWSQVVDRWKPMNRQAFFLWQLCITPLYLAVCILPLAFVILAPFRLAYWFEIVSPWPVIGASVIALCSTGVAHRAMSSRSTQA